MKNPLVSIHNTIKIITLITTIPDTSQNELKIKALHKSSARLASNQNV